jgi:hypothetical protein
MVTGGAGLSNLEIKLAAVPVYKLRGTVLDAHGHAVPKAVVSLGKKFGPSLEQSSAEDGVFEFSAVAEGEWQIYSTVDQEGVVVTYKSGGGVVRSAIENCGMGRVVLIPRDSLLRRSPFLRMTTCTASGHFEFRSVRPGDYFGFSIAGGSARPWDAAMLDETVLRQAVKVTVRQNESITVELAPVRLQ